MRIRAPANVFLHRAQVILILAALIPTILTTPVGIILLVTGGPDVVQIVAGVLVLAFAASSVTGFLIGGIFLRRGSALVRVQHDFLSAVSHELRTPMTSMRMFIEALLDERLTDPEQRAKCLRVLGQEVERLDGLVGRLIELSRLEADQEPFERIPVPVKDIVDQAVEAFGAVQLQDDTKLTVEVDDDLGLVGDRGSLVQLLVNLLTNAWKYSGEDKEISLIARLTRDKKEVEFIVRDNGPGVPAHEQQKIFEKFSRGHAAVESGAAGSGLGLAIVKAIVRAHRGRVVLESSEGKGASFHVFLPRDKLNRYPASE